jgi:hypothetical protein
VSVQDAEQSAISAEARQPPGEPRAVWVSQPDQAIDMAQAAQASAHRVGLPILETEGLVMEANAYALLGDAGACSRALERQRGVRARRCRAAVS